MSEEQTEYTTETQEAMDMLGKGYEHPSLEIHPQQVVIKRCGWKMEEEVIPAFVKISTAFKNELANINGDALKVWIFIALSINRNTENAHPGVRTIAKACKVGVNQVTIYVKQLEELGLLTVNREDRKYNIYKIPEYVSANTVTPQVTDHKTVTFPDETVTPKRESVTPISDLTREPEINQNLPLDWKIATGQKITQDDLEKEQKEKDVLIEFETAFGFGTLPWNSTKEWEKFARFLMRLANDDPDWPADYVQWRQGDGKYKAFSNRKIRENVQAFMDTGYPEYDACKMYREKTDKPKIDRSAVEATKKMLEEKWSRFDEPKPIAEVLKGM